MTEDKLLHWINTVNEYGRLRVFLNEKDAKECQEALVQIKKIIIDNKRLKKKIYELKVSNDVLQLQIDNPGGLL